MQDWDRVTSSANFFNFAGQDGSKLLHTFTPSLRDSIVFGKKSKLGLGGMESKISAATWALDRGACIGILIGKVRLRMEYFEFFPHPLRSIKGVSMNNHSPNIKISISAGVSVVICNGFEEGAIPRIIGGKKVGTFFTKHETKSIPLENLALNAKNGELNYLGTGKEARRTALRLIRSGNISNNYYQSVSESCDRLLKLDLSRIIEVASTVL